jgi:hypothetical protein
MQLTRECAAGAGSSSRRGEDILAGEGPLLIIYLKLYLFFSVYK